MSAILLKDLRESSFPIMVVVVSGLVYLGYRLARAMTFGLAISEAWADFVLYALTPCVILVAQRLVQREVQHGWPLLRQHPVRLGGVFVAKLLLGAVLVGLPLGIGAALNGGAGALLAFDGPNTYDALPTGTLVYLALVGALAVLASVFGRHAWTVGVGMWILLPHVGAASSAHPLRLIEARFVQPETHAGYVAAAAILCLAGVAFAGFGGRAPAAWRGRWGWHDRGAFWAVALIALGGLPTPPATAPLRGAVIELEGLCVRDLRHAPQASARIAALASETLALVPAALTTPPVAIEHGGGPQLEISAGGPLLLGRVDFLGELDPAAFQRDLLHGVLERVGGSGRPGWGFVRDGYPGYVLAGGRLAELPAAAAERARRAAATLLEAGLLDGDWLASWEGPVRRRVGDAAARELAAWLLLRAEPGDLAALVERWGEPLASAWRAGGFATDRAGFESASRAAAAEVSRDFPEAVAPGGWEFTVDEQRRVVLTPGSSDEETLVLYTAPCVDAGRVPRVFDRVEGPATLDPWRAGPFPPGRLWLATAHRQRGVEWFAGWQIVEIP